MHSPEQAGASRTRFTIASLSTLIALRVASNHNSLESSLGTIACCDWTELQGSCDYSVGRELRALLVSYALQKIDGLASCRLISLLKNVDEEVSAVCASKQSSGRKREIRLEYTFLIEDKKNLGT